MQERTALTEQSDGYNWHMRWLFEYEYARQSRTDGSRWKSSQVQSCAGRHVWTVPLKCIMGCAPSVRLPLNIVISRLPSWYVKRKSPHVSIVTTSVAHSSELDESPSPNTFWMLMGRSGSAWTASMPVKISPKITSMMMRPMGMAAFHHRAGMSVLDSRSGLSLTCSADPTSARCTVHTAP